MEAQTHQELEEQNINFFFLTLFGLFPNPSWSSEKKALYRIYNITVLIFFLGPPVLELMIFIDYIFSGKPYDGSFLGLLFAIYSVMIVGIYIHFQKRNKYADVLDSVQDVVNKSLAYGGETAKRIHLDRERNSKIRAIVLFAVFQICSFLFFLTYFFFVMTKLKTVDYGELPLSYPDATSYCLDKGVATEFWAIYLIQMVRVFFPEAFHIGVRNLMYGSMEILSGQLEILIVIMKLVDSDALEDSLPPMIMNGKESPVGSRTFNRLNSPYTIAASDNKSVLADQMLQKSRFLGSMRNGKDIDKDKETLLKHCVEHHQLILRSICILKGRIQPFILLEFFSFLIATVHVSSRSDKTSVATVICLIVFLALSSVYNIYHFEDLQHRCAEVARTAFQLYKWHGEKPFKRSLICILIRSLKKEDFPMFLISSVDFSTLYKFWNITFNIVTIMEGHAQY